MDGHELWLEQCRQLGYRSEPRRYEPGTRTSEDAAKQHGCDVAHIAKSIVFEGQGGAVVVIASGANRVDRKKKLKSLLGSKPGMSDTAHIETNTGYLPGGVPPFGHVRPCTVLMDEDLFRYPLVWGAAGSADTVFPITPQELQFLSGAHVGNVKQEVNA